MNLETELEIYLRARVTLIVLVTAEEERALEVVKRVCEKANRSCLTWDMAEGFQFLHSGPRGGSTPPTAKDPMTALEQVEKYPVDEAVFVFKDFHECWPGSAIKRKMRNVAQRLKFTRKSLLVTTPSSKVPDELRDEAVVIDLPPPGPEELEEVLEKLARTPGSKDEAHPSRPGEAHPGGQRTDLQPGPKGICQGHSDRRHPG